MEKKTYLERAVLEKLLTGKAGGGEVRSFFAWGDVAAQLHLTALT